MAPHGSAKSSTGGTKPGEHEPVDFLATGFKVKTNCAFSVKILENFKLRSDHLASGSAPAPTRLARPPPLRILLSWCPRPQPVHANRWDVGLLFADGGGAPCRNQGGRKGHRGFRGRNASATAAQGVPGKPHRREQGVGCKLRFELWAICQQVQRVYGSGLPRPPPLPRCVCA